MTKVARVEEKGAGGRSSEYCLELAEVICSLIITGFSVRKITEREVMPCEDTIYTCLSKHSEFSEKYTLACQHRTNRYMEECVDLADMMPDGVMFIAGNGNLYTGPRAMALQRFAPGSHDSASPT